MLPVVEMFYSIQGEGEKMGYPSIFIRLGGCNLTCKGFGCKTKSPKTGEILTGCDSIRAVNAKHFKDQWIYYKTWEELVNEINKLIPNNYQKPLIIITGGEPMLYNENEILINILEYYISRGYEVWFETNGTIAPDFEKYQIYKKCNFAISPKLSNSGEPKEKRFKPEIIDTILTNTKDSHLKFVLNKDLIGKEEIEEMLSKIPTYAKVFIMPQGGNKNELNESSKNVFLYALERGFHYSDRIHIRVFNDLEAI